MQKIICEQSGERLDVYLSKKTGLTRSHIKNLLTENRVFVNGKIQKSGYKMCEGDVITFEDFEKTELSAMPQNLPLEIVYEDADMLVVNKPQGMCVHPAVGNPDKTLVNALTFHLKNLSSVNGGFRPGIVHRLDKDTSGLLVVAKNDRAHIELARQIESKECHRFYMAVLVGNLQTESGQIVTNIARSKKNRQKMDVCDSFHGKLAVTKYRVVERLKGYTLVEFELKTGRTHQIRVHSKHIGHPIAGDKLYGIKNKDNDLKGQLLTAYKIVFFQPTTKKETTCQVELPEYFKQFVKTHR